MSPARMRARTSPGGGIGAVVLQDGARDSTLSVDTSHVRVTEFDLTEEKRNALIRRGWVTTWVSVQPGHDCVRLVQQPLVRWSGQDRPSQGQEHATLHRGTPAQHDDCFDGTPVVSRSDENQILLGIINRGLYCLTREPAIPGKVTDRRHP